MAKSLYFYDLETTGFNPREARIMQFAGQRTDLNLKNIGEPQNLLIKLTDDIVPDPAAIMVTGITPQQTIIDGITEADFLKIFHEEIVTPDTIFVGYNSVRFDDEFMRYLHYRNFYDPYEWQWRDGRAKWDLMDVVRMMRALRPDGINWPVEAGKPVNRLELLTKANNISHDGAHDALADVVALIELARLIHSNQPKLFNFLLSVMTSKANIGKLVNKPEPFVYTSSKYSSDFEKTTVVAKLVDHPKRQGVLVFDLRNDPSEYVNLSVDELVKAWYPEDRDQPRLPIKTLQFNRCPAVAPLNVLDEASQGRIKLTLDTVNQNFKKLVKHQDGLVKNVLAALKILDEEQDKKFASVSSIVDAQLYDGFFADGDKKLLQKVNSASASEVNTLQVKFSDKRLNKLLPLYKARNYPKSLTQEEVETWEKHRIEHLLGGNEQSRLAKYFARLEDLNQDPKLTDNQRFLVEELKLYGESILPTQD